MRRILIPLLTASVVTSIFLARSDTPVEAQHRLMSLVAQDQGHVALGLAVRRLNVTGTLMQVAAHPDDEHNQLYALLTLGQGMRSVDVQTTRGGGGQNEIGPELFQDIAVLRTSELMAAHQLDGAEQWFTRAIDYGYSFSPPEIYERWGREAIIGDVVRFLRTFRPDVLLTMNIQGRGGDRAHEATADLVRAAYRAAADPNRFPEQIQAGLRPWQAPKLYFTAGGFGGQPMPADAKLASVNADVYDELLGRTYQQIGADARSNHKCQGMGGLPPIPGVTGGRGGGPSRYQLEDTILESQKNTNETSLFDGIDVSLASLAAFAGGNPPQALTQALATIAGHAEAAKRAFATESDAATAAPIAAGLAAVRSLRAGLGSMGLSDTASYEIDFRLKQEEQDFADALLAAQGVTFEALANDGLVIGGQPVTLSLIAVNRGPARVAVDSVEVAGFDGQAACPAASIEKDGVFRCSADLQVPQGARLTTRYWTDEYWNTKPPKAALQIYPPDVPFGAPFRPTPFRATFHVTASGQTIVKTLPVDYRYVDDAFVGEKRMELNVVPAFSVRTTPAMAVIPTPSGTGAGPVRREIHVSVTNGTKSAAEATVALDVPAGWTSEPATAPLSFMHEDESLTARFTVSAPATVRPGEYSLVARVTSPATGATRFAEGYQVIDYPHIERRQVIKPADISLRVMDVKTTPGIRVGYIVGAGDQIPPALEQLGATVSFIESDELAWGDLSKYNVIVTGVRAYEKRDDLKAYNRRLLDFADQGGTVIVQYNKMGFNDAQYGPYPAVVGRGRVTDETAPVDVLVPDNPVFNVPNRIDKSAWDGWVQERGLYFLGDKDPRYVDLISMEDPFPDNPGVKTGALVEARVGKGRWLYVGLGLWRQAPAEVEGAYKLLANLISLGRPPSAAHPPAF